MGAGLGGRPPCLPQSGPYGCWVRWETSLSTTQSGPYTCSVSWGASLYTTQSGPYGCCISWNCGRPPCLPHGQTNPKEGIFFSSSLFCIFCICVHIMYSGILILVPGPSPHATPPSLNTPPIQAPSQQCPSHRQGTLTYVLHISNRPPGYTWHQGVRAGEGDASHNSREIPAICPTPGADSATLV